MAKASKQATRALVVLASSGIPFEIHRYEHDPAHESFGLEAAEKLGVAPERVFKTLIVALDGQLGVAVLPVAKMLDLKAVASDLNCKQASMADAAIAERTTGYIVGAISPLGQKKPLATTIDSSVNNYSTVFVSAGRRGLEVELAPRDLIEQTSATVAAIAR